jgi:hypothetical protein
MTKFTNDKRLLPFGHVAAIADPEALELLSNYNPNLLEILNDNTLVNSFCKFYVDWINKSDNHNLKGLGKYQYATYSHGTSEAFDKFYMRNHTRRFRCFKTEYLYHQLAWRNDWPNWKYIEDSDLESNDAVIISIPFSDTGDKHILHDEIISRCNKLNIPVLIDCAYFSISQGLEIDLDHPCITDVTFSLSKVFPIAHARIGLRLTKVDNDDTMFVYQKSAYNNRLGAALGIEFMKYFSSSYIPAKYLNKQIEFCKFLNLVPSKTVLFGIADRNWQEYNRGGLTNRLSLHKFLHLDIENLKGVVTNDSSIS